MLRSKEITIYGSVIGIRELSAKEALEVWPVVSTGLATGSPWEGSIEMALRCAFDTHDDRPYYATREEAEAAPARVILEIGNAVLAISDLGAGEEETPPEEKKRPDRSGSDTLSSRPGVRRDRPGPLGGAPAYAAALPVDGILPVGRDDSVTRHGPVR